MSTAAPSPAAVRALEHLIDYAGLFPPAALSLTEALAEYAAAAAGPHAWMLGRFILPAARLHELREQPAGAAPLPLSAIVAADDTAFAALAAERACERWSVEALEIPPADPEGVAELVQAHGWTDLPVYAEVPAAQTQCLAGLAAGGLRAKLRCGGVEPAAFPSVREVAGFIIGCARAGVAFKATAGLHHPVRHANAAAGVRMHGFVNLLAAAAFALEAPESTIEAIVAEEDPSAFSLERDLRWRDLHAGPEALVATRSRFVGYGSCSFAEPVDDLRAMHVLAA